MLYGADFRKLVQYRFGESVNHFFWSYNLQMSSKCFACRQSLICCFGKRTDISLHSLNMCVMVAVQNRQIAAVTRTIHPVSD